MNSFFSCNNNCNNGEFDSKGYIICYSNKNPIAKHSNSSKFLCALDVPSFLVPKDIILFFDSYSSHIETLKILKCSTNETNYEKGERESASDYASNYHNREEVKYIVLLQMNSSKQAENLMNEFNGQLYSSLDSTLCDLKFVKDISYTAIDEHQKNIYSNLTDVAITYFLYRRMSDTVNDNHQHGVVSSHALESAIITETTNSTEQDDIICAVCLESLQVVSDSSENTENSNNTIDNTSRRISIRSSNMVKFVMYCGHMFHSRCVERLEPPQCPVCRFEHDTSSGILTECSSCGWDGTQRSSHHSVTAVGSSSLLSSQSNTLNGFDPILLTPLDRDIWVCLVCGYTGCGLTHAGHIQSHYESHQHAYAMNTDTKHVFDFAGQGYVHRLVVQHQQDDEQDHNSIDLPNNNDTIDIKTVTDKMLSINNTSNNISSSSSSSSVRINNNNRSKVFEVNDPRFDLFSNRNNSYTTDMLSSSSSSSSSSTLLYTHTNSSSMSMSPWSRGLHRSSEMPLSEQEEQVSVAIKLEEIAAQHSVLLAREMALQRQQYEESIKKIQCFMQDEAKHLYLHTTQHSLSHSTPTVTTSTIINNSNCNSSNNSTVKKNNINKQNNNININTISSSSSSASSSSSSSSSITPSASTIVNEWLQKIHYQLSLEKQKNIKQHQTIKTKIKNKESEYQELLELNRGLRENEQALRTNVSKTQSRLDELILANNNWKQSLETKLQSLMESLETS